MLNLETIIAELNPLLLLFPEAGYDSQTIPLLAELWRDLLADANVSEQEFRWAVRRAKHRCKIFPKPADIVEGVNEYREHPPARVDAAHRLPQESAVPLSPEEIERNRARLEIITMQAAGQISPQDATRRLAELFSGPNYTMTAAQEAAQKAAAEEAAIRMAKLGHPAFNGTFV